jgi:DNA-binding MarR family transcriptional regulator
VEPDLQLDHQLCFALYAASRTVTHAYRDGLEPLGLTYPQYLVLLVLWETDGVTVTELGRRLHLDSGTLSPLLRRMEDAGFVERRRAEPDARKVTVHLTSAGRGLRERAEDVQRCLLPLARISLEEATMLRDLARRLIDETVPAPTPDPVTR